MTGDAVVQAAGGLIIGLILWMAVLTVILLFTLWRLESERMKNIQQRRQKILNFSHRYLQACLATKLLTQEAVEALPPTQFLPVALWARPRPPAPATPPVSTPPAAGRRLRATRVHYGGR